jgi:acetyl-CoA carboxylase biotin carboxyl carrier protein
MIMEVAASLPGKIVRMGIKTGDFVEDDEEMLIIEAMKMETPVFAPFDGTIKEIKIKIGDQVEEGDILVIIRKIDNKK